MAAPVTVGMRGRAARVHSIGGWFAYPISTRRTRQWTHWERGGAGRGAGRGAERMHLHTSELLSAGSQVLTPPPRNLAIGALVVCRLHAPCALGAYTCARPGAVCFGSTASASTPAECHTPESGEASATSRTTCAASLVSHRSRAGVTPLASTASSHPVPVSLASAAFAVERGIVVASADTWAVFPSWNVDSAVRFSSASTSHRAGRLPIAPLSACRRAPSQASSTGPRVQPPVHWWHTSPSGDSFETRLDLLVLLAAPWTAVMLYYGSVRKRSSVRGVDLRADSRRVFGSRRRTASATG